jgi:hypothetical protein
MLTYCAPGSYASDNRTCTGCTTLGTYSDGGQTSCLPCSAGRYATSTLISKLGCLAAPAGSYSTDGLTVYDCPRGSWSIAASSSCTPCAAGKASNVANSITANDCVDCGLGLYSPDIGYAVCPPCPQGSYAGATSALSVCQLCDIGQQHAQRMNASRLRTSRVWSCVCPALTPPFLCAARLVSCSCRQVRRN